MGDQPDRLDRDPRDSRSTCSTGASGNELWDAIMKAGEEFNIRPIAPCEARRIEAGIFNYGSDIRLTDTPLHVMGLERLVEAQPPRTTSARRRSKELRTKGVDRKLVGIVLDGDELRAEMSEYWPVHKDGKEGRLS